MAHCDPGGLTLTEDARTVVLVGNPNVGKSVVFNALTGTYVDVSNFPGTTVELSSGKLGEHDVVDTPGIYGVSSFNDEETVARDIVLSGDVVVNVVDAVHLERDLFLTLQLVDMGKPMVVALNMVDEARREGVVVDRDLLEDLLGVPVIEMVAIKGVGFDELKAALGCARAGHADHEFEDDLLELAERIGSRPDALLVLEADEAVAARHGVPAASPANRERIYTHRRVRVNDLVGHVVRETDEGATFAVKLSHAMLNPWTGVPMLLALLAAVYIIFGQWIAGGLVDLLRGRLMEGVYVPFVQSLVGHAFPPGSPLYGLLVGQFGLLTLTPVTLLGVILPLVMGFYLLLSLLEDTGYLPRIAALADRSLTSIGLNGRAVIPLILGLGCVTMGTLTTRILGSKRERFIATALMAIAVPCSAQLGIIAALMTRAKPVYTAAYFGILLAVFVVLGTVLNKLVPGQSTDLLIDLPPLRVPRFANVVKKSATKAWSFMREVALFFVGGSIVLGLLDVLGGLKLITRAMEPLVTGWLRLPPETATAFLMGVIRRDFGAAGFMTIRLTDPQLLVAMVTITLFVPCLASTILVLRERGPRYMLGLLFGSIGFAFLLGGLLARLLAVI
jgi:ferrous iron transport protein B